MRVSRRGQVTIPAGIREQMGFLPNTEVEFVVDGERVLLRKTHTKQPRGRALVNAMRGRAQGRMSTDQIMALTRGD